MSDKMEALAAILVIIGGIVLMVLMWLFILCFGAGIWYLVIKFVVWAFGLSFIVTIWECFAIVLLLGMIRGIVKSFKGRD